MNQSTSIRVIVVDGYELTREGIARIIERATGIVTVASCGLISDALSAIASGSVDVVILDYDSGCKHLIDVIPLARQQGFSGAFLVVTPELQDAETLDLLKHGAGGIVCRSDPPDSLISAVRKLHEGGWWLKDEHIKVMISSILPNQKPEPRSQLSPRERTVLNAVVDGQTSKQIALDLGITEGAVKSTLQHLFRKTGTRSRGQLIKYALERLRGSPAKNLP
ncbi:MAG TPA: response regulator transcription factor [Bryobacteraceae bacterium]|nr:response regulator transcription factor [Bryobacteraceae bacterium]